MPSGPGTLLAGIADAPDVASVMSAVTDALRAWLGVGPVFLAAADPITGLFSEVFTYDIPAGAAAAFFEIERTGTDVVRFRDLAAAAEPAGSLFQATAGAPATSVRGREVILPLGWGDELRAVVRAHGSTWGYLCLHREAADRPFSGKDVQRLNTFLPAVAAAMRRAALPAPASPAQLPTGVVLVDDRGRVVGTTGGAEAWLDELGPRPPGALPLLIAGLARQVFESGRPATSTAATRAGRLGVIDAAPLHGPDEPRVAVVISAAPTAQVLDRLAAATGLTSREYDVAACVLRGLSTRAIAEELAIAPSTVQAHLTSIFGKTGLRSRRELVTRLRG